MSAWFDTPNPTPRRRRPMAELLVELADRNGDPVWATTNLSVADSGLLREHGGRDDVPRAFHGTVYGWRDYECTCIQCTVGIAAHRERWPELDPYAWSER